MVRRTARASDPADFARWVARTDATLQHLARRRGRRERAALGRALRDFALAWANTLIPTRGPLAPDPTTREKLVEKWASSKGNRDMAMWRYARGEFADSPAPGERDPVTQAIGRLFPSGTPGRPEDDPAAHEAEAHHARVTEAARACDKALLRLVEADIVAALSPPIVAVRIASAQTHDDRFFLDALARAITTPGIRRGPKGEPPASKLFRLTAQRLGYSAAETAALLKDSKDPSWSLTRGAMHKRRKRDKTRTAHS